MRKYSFYLAAFFVALRILTTAVAAPKSVIMPGKVPAAIYDSDGDDTADIVIKRDTTALKVNKIIKTKPTPEEQQYFLTHK